MRATYEAWADSVEGVSCLAHLTASGVSAAMAEKVMRVTWEAAVDAAWHEVADENRLRAEQSRPTFSGLLDVRDRFYALKRVPRLRTPPLHEGGRSK